MKISEMRMLREMCGANMLDTIRNEYRIGNLRARMRENRLKRYGFVNRRGKSETVEKISEIRLEESQLRWRSKKKLVAIFRGGNIKGCGFNKVMDREMVED